MRYAFLMYCNEDAAVSDLEKEHREKQFASMLDKLGSVGVLADSQLLRPARDARTVRCWDGGDIMVTDRPLTQTREQLTGWIIAECEDLEAALRLATTMPAAWYGSVEVRAAGL